MKTRIFYQMAVIFFGISVIFFGSDAESFSTFMMTKVVAAISFMVGVCFVVTGRKSGELVINE